MIDAQEERRRAAYSQLRARWKALIDSEIRMSPEDRDALTAVLENPLPNLHDVLLYGNGTFPHGALRSAVIFLIEIAERHAEERATLRERERCADICRAVAGTASDAASAWAAHEIETAIYKKG